MYSRKRTPRYVDYRSVEIQTQSGLSYSIAQLLARVVRNQPIPMMAEHDDSGLDDPVDPRTKKHVRTDQEIDDHIDQQLADPMNDPDLDLVSASEAIQDITIHESLSKQQK